MNNVPKESHELCSDLCDNLKQKYGFECEQILNAIVNYIGQIETFKALSHMARAEDWNVRINKDTGEITSTEIDEIGG